ncbi:Dabb family protein [Paenibacillus chitinolyticus]|uniref:Dabb family protein n=1 Tax=Paenibacillus chitinolyticus TaxID=79263 RepID=UPI002DB916FB|nr:Dabb family protein [Paenibacillus chitinolyticus]MEC0249143.1 Dabb family protein [Paenibacillus chitinolyticus]
MITHVVFFKLKDRSPESVEQARAKLQNMEGKISELLHIEVGADVIHSERSYDLALITKFNSLEDLKAYNVHPVHQDVLAYMVEAKDGVAPCVDFES